MKKTILLAVTLLFIAFGGVSFAYEMGKIEVHGFLSQSFIQTPEDNDYLAGDSSKGSFSFNEYALNLSTQITPDLRAGIQFFGQERGNYGGDKPELDLAYLDYRLSDYFGFRAGKIKIPLGFYNESRDNPMTRISSIMPQSVYNEYARETVLAVSGAGLYASTPRTPFGLFTFQFNAGAIHIPTDGGVVESYKSFVFKSVNKYDTDTTIASSIQWDTPIENLKLGVSQFHTAIVGNADLSDMVVSMMHLPFSTVNADFDAYDNIVYSAEYSWRDFIFASEFSVTNYEYKLIGLPIGQKVRTEGWYINCGYQVNNWLTVGSYYSAYRFIDINSKRNSPLARSKESSYQDDLALTLRFDPVRNMCFKLEGHKIRGTGLVPNALKADDDWYMGIASVAVSF